MKTVAFPLLGRSAELDRLSDLLAAARAGRGAVAVIEGEPGIGKSRLLEELTRRATQVGFLAFSGAAQELEGERPFGLIREALLPAVGDREKIPELDGLLGLLDVDTPGRLDPAVHAPDARFQAVDMVSATIERIAARTPVIVVLDDLHWADPSSLMTISRLSRSAASSALLLVGSSRVPPRPPEVERCLETMLRRGAVHIELGPLHAETVDALVVEAVGSKVGPRLRRLAGKAAGNPLLVVELLRALLQEGAIDVKAGVADIDREVIPPSVRGTVARRVRLLPPATMDVLRIAAVLGRSFAIDDLITATAGSELELAGVIEQLRVAGLVEDRGTEFAFRHDLVRQAIYEEMAVGVRRSLHAAVGRALAESDRPAGLVAAHLSLGAAPGDKEAVGWLTRAAREAAALDPVSAADLMKRAIELTTVDAERMALAPELVAALVSSGHLVEAEKEATRGLAVAPAEVRRPLQLGLACALLLQSRWSEAAEHFADLATDPVLDEADRARMRSNEALARAFGLENEAARRVALQAESLAVESGCDAALVLALQAQSITLMFEGYAFEGIELGGKAVEVALASEDEEAMRLHPELLQGFALVNADRLEEGERLLREGRERGKRLGTVWDIPLYHWYLSIKLFHAGEWDEAVAELEAGLAVADQVETNWELLNLYGTLANITLHRGDFRRSEALLREVEQRIHPSRAPVALIWYAWTRALLAEAKGDTEGGYRYLADQWDKIRERDVVAAARWLGPDLVRFALAVSDEERALSVAAVADEGAERAPFESSLGTAHHCRGLIERDRQELERAAARYEAGGRPFHRALALEEAGVMAERDEDREGAVSLLQSASEIYEALGASYDLARSESHLRELGVRRARPRRGGRPQSGWESLTETERKVVAHVAEGLTNPEIARRMFVSPRTISTHLKHVFKKLGVTSRVELATQATRRDSA